MKHKDTKTDVSGVEEGLPHVVTPDGHVKTRWERSWPTIACGAGLFSDGYVQSVCLPSYLMSYSDTDWSRSLAQ